MIKRIHSFTSAIRQKFLRIMHAFRLGLLKLLRGSQNSRPTPSVQEMDKVIIMISEALWQVLQHSVVSHDLKDDALEDITIIVRNAIDDLSVHGIELVDLSGNIFERGMVDAKFFTDERYSCPTIAQMEIPRIMWNGRIIYRGAAFIGEPPRRLKAAKTRQDVAKEIPAKSPENNTE
jgi:hypothetical protein